MHLIRAWLGILAPLGFSSKGSSSASTSNTTTNTYNTDRRLVADAGAIGVSAEGNVTVTPTDHDAIKRSFDLATVSSTNNINSINQAVKFASDALKLSSEGVNNVLERGTEGARLVQSGLQAAANNIGDAYRTAQDSASGLRFMVGAGLVVALVAGVLVFNKKKAA